jgi:hypothetical protein
MQVRVLRLYRSEDGFVTRRLIFPAAYSDHVIIDDYLALLTSEQVLACTPSTHTHTYTHTHIHSLSVESPRTRANICTCMRAA